jgi:hypothetical protein
MNALNTVASGLYAALRLTQGRADGIRLVPGDRTSAARSFWAILFCVPSVVCHLLIAWAEGGIPSHAGYLMARELIVFALGWLIFVEATVWIAPMLGRAERWGRFIALWNWCNVMEGLLIVIGAVPGLLGAPPIVDEACQLIMIGWALWLEWYAIRLGLGAGPFAAVWLVILDQSIGITLAAVAIILGS